MRNFRKLLLIGPALLLVETASAIEVVKTAHPTRDVVLAEKVLSPSGANDFADNLQKAIDTVAAKGGGTVFMTVGNYPLRKPITVRRGVTVRGDYTAAFPFKGTVLELHHGRGDAEARPAFEMENGGGLEGLVFFHPEQTPANPTPYPWTVRTAPDGRAGNNQTILDCTFVNSWRGLRVGPEVNECHTFRRVRICALSCGVNVDMTTDIGRITDVTISPKVWSSSGFPNAPSETSLRDYLQSHDTVAAEYARSDWEFIRGLHIDGYRTGIRFNNAPVPTNAVLADSTVSDCLTALEFIQLNWVGVACYNCRFSGSERTVACADGFRSTVLFNACTLSGGKSSVSAKGTLSFSHCAISSPLDNARGGKLERIEGDALPQADKLVAPKEMTWPRPIGRHVLDAADFGVSSQAADNTAALQRALDAAGRESEGATVYLEAGYFRCLGTLNVPTGIELRGSSDVPHHTQNAGTYLLASYGKGDESAKPFVNLAPRSGLRGLGIWYPEQSLTEPVAYPWSIRALGPGCWLTDVNLGNSWLGADFATNRSDGHRISYVSGGFFKVGVYIGNCATSGWVEDLQFNPHYMLRRPAELPFTSGPRKNGNEHPAYLMARKQLRAMAFRDCADEQIAGTFVYAAREGMLFKGKVKAQVLIHGTDTGCRGIRLSTEEGSQVNVALAQLVPIGADEESAIFATAANNGDSVFSATQIWPRNPVIINRGKGRILLDQFNSCAGGIDSQNDAVTERLGHHSR